MSRRQPAYVQNERANTVAAQLILDNPGKYSQMQVDWATAFAKNTRLDQLPRPERAKTRAKKRKLVR